MDISPKSLVERSKELSNRMMSDIERPWYLVEFTSILSDLSSLIVSIVKRQGELSALEQVISSLEHRYSELLYKLSDEHKE